MKYLDAILVILYLAVLVLIIIEFSGLWALATALLIILIISSLQKSYFEGLYKKIKDEKEELFENINDKLDLFSNGIEAVRKQMEQNSTDLDNRLTDMQDSYSRDIEKTYRDLTGKIVEIENKLGVVKRTLGAAYGAIDERINKLEGVLNVETEEEKTF